MNKLVLAVEPFGDYEFDVADMLNNKSKKVGFVLIEGEKKIPEPDYYDDIEVLIYQMNGHNISRSDEIEDLEESGVVIKTKLDDYIKATIQWYEKKGFKAEKIPALSMITPL